MYVVYNICGYAVLITCGGPLGPLGPLWAPWAPIRHPWGLGPRITHQNFDFFGFPSSVGLRGAASGGFSGSKIEIFQMLSSKNNEKMRYGPRDPSS